MNEALARTDPLTGIPNRRNFYENAEQEWNRFTRFSIAFCIAMIDLDQFKKVNDTYGHAIGDDVLRRFSTLIATQTRSTDFFAHVGGEEFAFLFTGTNQNDAVNALARLRDKVLTRKMLSPDLGILVTFSDGIAETRAEDKSLDDTIRRADQALYRAKELGRDRIEQG